MPDTPSLMEDVARFEAMYDACFDRVLAYALARSDVQAAKDTAAEVFLVAWRRRSELPSEPLPWLLGVARKTLATSRRSAGRRSALADRVVLHRPSSSSDDLADAVVERDAALAALERLSPSDRELLCLLAWDGLTPAEAAESLGVSSSTFAVRVHRARRRFDSALADLSVEDRS